MLRCTAARHVRLPKCRRPRERPWEIFNTRDFGFHEGSQNYAMWLLCAVVATALLGLEVYQQSKRILARGDTCPACEAARAHYRARAEEKEREMSEIYSRESSRRVL
ncbi:hypothetical protein STCU_06619 [Strigomonas culicis]|uniref:Uncharacterized protein n=1 Tax=Strigomonas culicis TaxID=28005 RepID=S9UA73_9TRYP|nr:hypothetical protein STCU_06619 [Strigomonas culicis]|eukprot:EPY25624.1 hypothetical protein STCU_06619 [Strigomonas culicis]